MPAYNVAHVLGAALASVLAQTYKKIEVILIDDGSTDGTHEVARSITDERVRCWRNMKNLGEFQTMNKAVSLARGDLVAIYHSDDVYEPTIVQKEVTYLLAHPEVGALFCMDHFMDDMGHIFGGTNLPAEFLGRESLRYEDVFPFLVRHKNVLFRCPTFMARREVLDAAGPYDGDRYSIAADLDMWIRIVRQCPVGILNERLVRYRVGKGQYSTRYNYLRTEPEQFFLIMDRYLTEDAWQSKLSRTDLSEYAFHRCDDETFRAINWLLKGDPARAAELLRHGYTWGALRRMPTLRKIRLLALRFLLWLAVQLRPAGWLKRLLHHLAYRRRSVPC